MNRRQLLAGATAAVVASPSLALPATSSSTFAEMGRRINENYAKAAVLRDRMPDGDAYEEAVGVLWDEAWELAREIDETPPRSLADVIAKLRWLIDERVSEIESHHAPCGTASIEQCLAWLEQHA